MAALRTLDRFDDQRGTLYGYAATAAYRSVQAFLLRESSPVSCPSHDDLSLLVGLHRETVAALDLDPTFPDPEAALDTARRSRAVADIVAEVIAADPALAPGFRVLVEGAEPRAVAEAAGLPVQTVYRARDRLKKRLEQETSLWLLWQEG